MRNLFRLLVLLVVVVFGAGCDSSGDDFNIEDYLGTYEGPLTVAGFPIGTITHTFTADLDAGTVTLTVEQDGLLVGELPGDGELPEDLPMEVTGTFDAGGMVFDQSIPELGTVSILTVDAEENVTGEFVLGSFDAPLTAEVVGTLTPENFDLELTFRIPDAFATEDFPAGTEILVLQFAERVGAQ